MGSRSLPRIRGLNWSRLYSPQVLTGLALVVAWFGIYFAFQGHWLGLAFPLVTTLLTLAALRRGDALAGARSEALRQALSTAAAGNRELERLRHLAATMLAGTELPGLVNEVAH